METSVAENDLDKLLYFPRGAPNIGARNRIVFHKGVLLVEVTFRLAHTIGIKADDLKHFN
jgi:hypothetical protein